MVITKTTYIVLGLVTTVMLLSITVFKSGKGLATGKQNIQLTNPQRYEDRRDRYPIAQFEEGEPSDPAEKAKLRKQKLRYDKDAPFTNPGLKDEELAFRPEWAFNFPALPVAQSDVIVIGQVLSAHAHCSANKMNVFSNFEVRVDEVLKGSNLTDGSVITIERIGGFVQYPNGRRVLFRLSGNGMPAVGSRYALFLNCADEDYSILTGYELATAGVLPLDNSRQFQTYQGQSETSFLKALRDAVSQSLAQ